MTSGCTISSATSLKLASGEAVSAVSAPSTNPTASDLTGALKVLMGSESTSAGVFKVTISAAGTPSASQWSKSESDLYIGAYPVAAEKKSDNGLGGAKKS